MKDFQVQPIEHQVAKSFVEQWHYSKKLPSGLNICFGAFLNGELYAVADYGAGSNMDKGAALARRTGLPVRFQDVTQEWLAKPHKYMNTDGLVVGALNCLELKRLCRQGEKGAAKIPLTQFLSICHRTLRRDRHIRFIVSYSDPGELRAVPVEPWDDPGPYRSRDGRWQIVPPESGPNAKQQSGHIYRAANFQHLGLTAPETHTVDRAGNIFHRRIAYKEMKRQGQSGSEALEAVRQKYGRVPIKTPPKERWFIALEPSDAKNLARRLLAEPSVRVAGLPEGDF